MYWSLSNTRNLRSVPRAITETIKARRKSDGNELGGEAVGDGLDVRLAVRGLLDHVDLGDGGLVADFTANHTSRPLFTTAPATCPSFDLAQGHIFAGDRR